jgi:plasmid maintenance system killer protein
VVRSGPSKIVELQFATPELRRLAETEAGCATLLQQRHGAPLCQRLCELASADNLDVVRTLPALDLDREGQDGRWSVRISDSHRLVFVGTEENVSEFAKITCVQIVAIERV